MTSITQSVPHHTQWESLPASLRPPVLTTTQKMRRVAWNLFSILIPIIGLARLGAYLAARLSLRVLLPATYQSEECKKAYRLYFNEICSHFQKNFEVTRTTVITPDGAPLSVHLFKHRQATDKTPTTIYFGGNGALKGMGGWSWMLEESFHKNIPQNLVLFDYRSVDESGGKFNGSKDLLVDGASVVDWVRKILKIPNDRINLYGMSLGGAVAVKTAAADDQLTGWVVNERSFSSLGDIIHTFRPRLHWLIRPLVPLAIWILRNQGLELDAAADLPKLKGKKLVIYHAHDPIIPYIASMARKAPQHAFQLQGHSTIDNHHCSDLCNYQGAQDHISNFIFSV